MDANQVRATAEERFTAAVERERALRKEWQAQGMPITTLGGATGSAEVMHPLLAELRQAEAHASRLGREILAAKKPAAKSVGGRPQGSSSAPDRAASDEPPMLRAVK